MNAHGQMVDAAGSSVAVVPGGDNSQRRRSRHDEVLLAAFVTGATVGEAARQAGVSTRTVQRWRADHWPEVVAARREALDGVLTRVRSALPAALTRLEQISRDSEDEAVATRAALGIWEIFGRVSDRMELEERIAALEEKQGARP